MNLIPRTIYSQHGSVTVLRVPGQVIPSIREKAIKEMLLLSKKNTGQKKSKGRYSKQQASLF
jgi:hypothetical protein